MAYNVSPFTLCEDAVHEYAERITQIAFSPNGASVVGDGGPSSWLPYSLLASARAGNNASSVLSIRDVLPDGTCGVSSAPNGGPPFNSLRHLAWRPRALPGARESRGGDAASSDDNGHGRLQLSCNDSLLLSSLDAQAVYEWVVSPTTGGVRERSHTYYSGFEPIDISYSVDGRMKCLILGNERESCVRIMRAIECEDGDDDWEMVHSASYPVSERCVKRSFFGRSGRSLTLVSLRISSHASATTPSHADGTHARPPWRSRAPSVPTSLAGGRNALLELMIATAESEWRPVPVERACQLNFPFDWYATISIDATGDLAEAACATQWVLLSRRFPGDLRVAAAGGYGTFYIMDPADPSAAVTCHPPLLSRKCCVAWSPCGTILAVAGLGIGAMGESLNGGSDTNRLWQRRDTLDYSATDACLKMHLYLYDRLGRPLASVDLGAHARPSERCYLAWDASLFPCSFAQPCHASPDARTAGYPLRMALAHGSRVSIISAVDHRPYLQQLGALCPVPNRDLCLGGTAFDVDVASQHMNALHVAPRTNAEFPPPYSDAELELPSGRVIPCHRLFLSRSPVLAAALRGESVPSGSVSPWHLDVRCAESARPNVTRLRVYTNAGCFWNDAAVDLTLRFLYYDRLPFENFREALQWGEGGGVALEPNDSRVRVETNALDRAAADCVRLFLAMRLWPLPLGIADHLESTLAASQWVDVGVECAGVCVPAHKAILYARSEYFRALFTTTLGSDVACAPSTCALECRDALAAAAMLRFLYVDWVRFGRLEDKKTFPSVATEGTAEGPFPLTAEEAWATAADMYTPRSLAQRLTLALDPSLGSDIAQRASQDGVYCSPSQIAVTDAFGSIVAATVEAADMLGVLSCVGQCVPLLQPHAHPECYAEFSTFALTRGGPPQSGAMRTLLHLCDDLLRIDLAACATSVAVACASPLALSRDPVLRELADRMGRIAWRRRLVEPAAVLPLLSALDAMECSAVSYDDGPLWDAALDGLVAAYDEFADAAHSANASVGAQTASSALLFGCANVRKVARDGGVAEQPAMFADRRSSLFVHTWDDHCDICREKFGHMTRRKKVCRCCERKVCARCTKRTHTKVVHETKALVVDSKLHTACRSCAALAAFL